MTQLCLHRRNGADHEDWGYTPDPEDKQFAALIQTKVPNHRYLNDDKRFIRFDLKRANKALAESTLRNKPRYTHLLSIMEKNTDTFLLIH